MRRIVLHLIFLLPAFTTLLALSLTSSAWAQCSTSENDFAWTEYWVERDSDCDCVVWQAITSCDEPGGEHTQTATIVGTVEGSCSPVVACEDLPGYDNIIGLAELYQTTGFECDEGGWRDLDQDGYPQCIDEDEFDPRVTVNLGEVETLCDGVDNDADALVDEGLTGCDEDADHKRVGDPTLYQGDAASAINLVEGSLLVRQVDARVQGPFGPLVLTRTFDSRRDTDDAGFGIGWVHSYATYLDQMVAGDDRWRVQLGTGEELYFRCTAIDGSNSACASDDHRPRGNLVRMSDAWFFLPGDGTRIRFDTTLRSGRYAWILHQDGAGNTIAGATTDGAGLITQVTSANPSIYLSFVYDSAQIDVVRVNGTSSSENILNYSFDGDFLDSVQYASAIGTFGTYLVTSYDYDGDDLSEISERLGSSAYTTALFTYSSGRLASIGDRTKDLEFAYGNGDAPSVYPSTTLTLDASAGETETQFEHNGLWVRTADSDIRLGGIPGVEMIRDGHGRTTCVQTTDTRAFVFTYDNDGDSTEGDGMVPTLRAEYETGSTCSDLDDLAHRTWLSWEYNSASQSWRPEWRRTFSVLYSSLPSDCTASSLPAGCRETLFEYVSSSDDRLQWVTRTGYTKNVSNTVSQQVRRQRLFYYGLDTGVCDIAYGYPDLPCRMETQDGGGTVFARAHFTYTTTAAATGGLLTGTQRYKASGTFLSTSFADHNPFGSPATVTDERGMETTYSYNGWNAVTQKLEDDAMKDNGGSQLDPLTQYSYTNMRTLDTITLPRDNQIRYLYGNDEDEFLRLKAYALADPNGELTEILRYDNDGFGRQLERRVLDSIDSGSPCDSTDEDCTTPDTRSRTTYDGIGRAQRVSLYETNVSDPPDAYLQYTYVNGRLDRVRRYGWVDGTGSGDDLFWTTRYEYDARGRLLRLSRAEGGTDAETTYAYDGESQLLTTTSPTGVVTRTEHNDFGEVVLERSLTRGDIRREFDVAGRKTRERESQYNSASSAQSQCYAYDWLGRVTEHDQDCNSSVNTTLYYDGDSTPSDACESGLTQVGRLSMVTASFYKRVLCYHNNGRIHSAYQVMGTDTWSNSAARGISRIYDENGNLQYEYLEDRPDNTDHARQIEYNRDTDHMVDRVRYVRQRLTSSGSWVDVTSTSGGEVPTYFAFGGFETIHFANGVVETNEYDSSRRVTRRATEDPSTSTIYTDINLAYDVRGNITDYVDSTGKRHIEYYAAYDDLNRLRCLGRSSISSCSAWEDDYLETFTYDDSGNRTARKFGDFDEDDDEYTYVSGSDVIDTVSVSGTNREMSNSVEGEITEANTPVNLAYSWSKRGELSTANDDFLGDTIFSYSFAHDMFQRTATCNSRKTFMFYEPTGNAGASHQVRVQDTYDSCGSQYPRHLRSYIYLEGRPIAAVQSERTSGSDNQLEGGSCATPDDCGTFWIHTDQLGTPILVTDANGLERWRWENDPFGRQRPIDFNVASMDVDPDDDSSYGDPERYNTCCCDSCGETSCNDSQTGCSTTCCQDNGSQDVVWSREYDVSAPSYLQANNVRLHFSEFDVAAGTTRTNKDYVNLRRGDNSVIAQLTGNLGAHWTDWAGEGETTITVELVSDNVQDGTRGIVIDQLEFTSTATTGRFVLDLRMPGQVWDADAYASYNFRRWYRSEDGRYLTPDPIGLAGGEAGYFGYVGANPLGRRDPTGLLTINPPASPPATPPDSGIRLPSLTSSFDWSRVSEEYEGFKLIRFLRSLLVPAQAQECTPVPLPDSSGVCNPQDGYEYLGVNFPECVDALGMAGGGEIHAECINGLLTCRVCDCPFVRPEVQGVFCDTDENGSFTLAECPPQVGVEPSGFVCSTEPCTTVQKGTLNLDTGEMILTTTTVCN